MLTDLQARAALDERAVLLNDLLPGYHRHAAQFWAVEGEVPEWEALALAGTVVERAWAALAELPNLRGVAEILQAYVDRWWRVDRAYQRYRAGFEGHLGLDDVADTVGKLHRRYLEETNKRFAESLASDPGLEATGLPPQRSFWPASAGGWRAVLVLDAFRFDLARELEEKLPGAGGQVTVDLQALRAPLPSITPLGMASLSRLRRSKWTSVTVPGRSGLAALMPMRLIWLQRQDASGGGVVSEATSPLNWEVAGSASAAGAAGNLVVCLFHDSRWGRPWRSYQSDPTHRRRVRRAVCPRYT